MPKSLADLRAEKAARSAPIRSRRVYRAVVGEGLKYVIETQQLAAEQDDLVLADAGDHGGPRKMGAQTEASTRLAAIRDRLAELRDLMAEYEGDLTIEATKTDGEWEQWRIAHPARGEDDPGFRADLDITRGHCNGDALLAELATYVVEWNGEPLAPGDFDAMEMMRGDKKEIARRVVSLYEASDDLPKLLSGLSVFLKNEQSSS